MFCTAFVLSGTKLLNRGNNNPMVLSGLSLSGTTEGFCFVRYKASKPRKQQPHGAERAVSFWDYRRRIFVFTHSRTIRQY